ncbi:MAG: sensor histidine kinase [Bacteroidota bacterium]
MDQPTENNIAFLLLLGIIGMLILAVAVILFFVFYQRRLLAQQEKMQQMELDHQKRSLAFLLQGQEAERKRIAQELHDGIGALLSAAKLYVNRLDGKKTEKDLNFIKQETGSILDDTIDNIRRITRDLMPTNLERFGLIAATEDLAKRINDLGQIKFVFHCNEVRRIDEQKEFALYRMVQELINNSLKYADASEIQLHMIFEQDHLQMTYRDDGKGFDLENWQKDATLQEGLGLRGIESRASFLGASLQLHSAPEKGFSLELYLSLLQRETANGKPSPDFQLQ